VLVGTESVQTRIGTVDLVSGYPTEASVERLYDELDFQRAVQAYVWATPTVAIEAMRIGNWRDYGSDYNVLNVVDSYTTPAVVALTGNSTSIYAAAFVDISIEGPVVVDSPTGAYGVIDDYWQRPACEVGPFGPDLGQGGKFVLVPHGFSGDLPADVHVVRLLTNRAIYLVRGTVVDGDIQSAVETLSRARIYPLSQIDDPPDTRILLAGDRPIDTVAPRGFEYWQLLADILDHEPVEPRDRFFHAMLKPLGIEKGIPFAPDERQTRILTEAAEVGFLMAQTLSMAPRLENASGFPGTHWEWVLTLNADQEAEHYAQLDERTDYTFEAITIAEGMIKPIVGAGSQYMSAAKDDTGAWLDGSKSYRLHVPPDVPVLENWSVTVYDNLTRSMLKTPSNRPAASSFDELETNPDGSVDLHFGPTPPKEHRKNWLQTVPDKGWFAYFRWYGPTQDFFDGGWRLPDITAT
jgi:hypothetical protein